MPREQLQTADQHLQELLQTELSRRDFLKWLLAFLISLQTGLGMRFLENFLHENKLSAERRQQLIDQAARYPKQTLGIHPDFDKIFYDYHTLAIDDAQMHEAVRGVLDTTDYFRNELGEQFTSIGVFIRLEEVADEPHWDKARKLLTAIFTEARAKNVKVMLNLGVGGIDLPAGHAFDAGNEEVLVEWLGVWLDFLAEYADDIDVIRPFFEANLYGGEIGYITQQKFQLDEQHALRFRELFTRVRSQIKERLGEVAVHVSLAAYGWEYQQYFTEEADGVGIDVYDMTDSRFELSAHNLVLGRQHADRLMNYTVNWLGEKSGTHPTYLHEFGSKTQDMEWMEKMLLEFFAQGGRGAWMFLVNKLDQLEGIDWSLSEEKLAMLLSLYKEIDAIRNQQLAEVDARG